jgi:hypothetical protein
MSIDLHMKGLTVISRLNDLGHSKRVNEFESPNRNDVQIARRHFQSMQALAPWHLLQKTSCLVI